MTDRLSSGTHIRLKTGDGLIKEMIAVLRECEEYFDQRADAEYLYGQAAAQGNEEMRLLCDIRAVLPITTTSAT